jgi:hypothetical protein
MTTYEVLVDGHLDDHWAGWFGGLSIERRDDGTSSMTADVTDQAQLHGLLASIRDINARLVSVRTLDPQGSAGPSQ